MIELLLEAERMLSIGQLDRADQLYRQVADADPHNSIAVVGLGRVARERGDDLGAYLLVRRALAIDPENEAARRLAARIEEQLATRGEPVADPLARPTTASTEPPFPEVPAEDPPAADASPDVPAASRAASAPPARRPRSLLDRLRRR